jgi:hypothetical protein
MFECQSLLLSLEQVPEHPNLIKMPSLSRSLRENVLPNTILSMRKNPELIKETKSRRMSMNGAPNFSTRKRKTLSQPISAMYGKSSKTKPITGSHTYNKFVLSVTPKSIGSDLHLPRPPRIQTRPLTARRPESSKFFAKVQVKPKSARRKLRTPRHSESALPTRPPTAPYEDLES